MGSNKTVADHMNKLRSVYKQELDVFWEQPKVAEELPPSDFLKPTAPFDLEKAMAKQAEKEKEQRFEMVDNSQP